jgi:hypothetical protein
MGGLTGSRRRVVAAPVAAAIGAGLAVALALWATGREATSAAPGRPPWKIAGILLCRGPFGVAGYRTERDGRVTFPFTHPDRPKFGERPARCFRSLDDARHADYLLAPLPAGVHVVRGIYLVPPTRDLVARCRSADRRLPFSVPCPGLVPSRIAWGCDPCLYADSFVLEGEANAPYGYGGKFGENANHLVIAASTDRNRAHVTCIGGTAEGKLNVRGRRVRLERCPEGSTLHSGHLLAQWKRRGVRYALSLHGSDPRNQALLRALIAGVREGR